MKINNPTELLKYMQENIEYGYLGKNNKVYHFDDKDFDKDWYEQYVLENYDDVLNNKFGNCWDQVEFEREWFKKHNYEVKTFYEQVVLDYENSYSTHTFLAFKENNKWFYFENADFNNRGIHEYNTLKELIDDVLKRYIKFLKNQNIKDEELSYIVITEYEKPNEHISAEEFIDYVLKEKKIINRKDNYLERWTFKVENDYLTNLVLKKRKMATTSIYHLSRLSKIGEESIILYEDGLDACKIKIKNVIVTEFKNITWDLASLEGENNNLDEWRDIHYHFFRKIDPNFNENTKVIFEIFEVIEKYKKSDTMKIIRKSK